MSEDLAIAIAAVIGAGVCAQWVAHSLRLPSVLVLLPAGVLVGPVLGLVDPVALFGEALYPAIAIAVGLVLFEGGFGLQLSGSRALRRPVIGLVTAGVAITWLASGLAAVLLFGLPARVGLLLSAILVVSGPTVVLPLLASVRLRDPVRSILRWECIVVDPIGAVLAVAVFEAIVDADAGINPLVTLATSTVVGTSTGVVAGLAVAALLRRHAVPDRLHNPLTLASVVGCFVLANLVSVEAGLFTTTVMGVVLANQRVTPVAHIAAFGEDLGVVVLGGLFVVLGSTVDLSAVSSVWLPSLGMVVVLLAVRPAVVWASTVGSELQDNERWYLSLIAPRGVVAASVAALFAVSLQRRGIDGAALLAPTAFCVIIGTAVSASLVARPAARWLRVAEAERCGVLLAGHQRWLLDSAAELSAAGVPVLVVPVDGDGDDAAGRDLLTYSGPLDGDGLAEAIEAVGVHEAVIAVDADAVTPFLVERLSELLGRRHVFRVPSPGAQERQAWSRAWGRRAFSDAGAETPRDGWSITTLPATALTDRSPDVVPLFLLRPDRSPLVLGPTRKAVPEGTGVVVARRARPAVAGRRHG